MVLDVLKRAVAEALERKRKLGQYAVIWRDGRVVCIGADAPGDQRRGCQSRLESQPTGLNANTPEGVLLQRRVDCDVTVT